MWVLIQAWFKLNSIVLFCGRGNSIWRRMSTFATLFTIDIPVLSEQAMLKHTELKFSWYSVLFHQFLLLTRQQHSSSVRSLQNDYLSLKALQPQAAPTPMFSLWPRSGLKNVWAVTDCAWSASVWPSERPSGWQSLHMFVLIDLVFFQQHPHRLDSRVARIICRQSMFVTCVNRLPTIFDISTMHVKSCPHYIFITRLLKCRSRPSIPAFVNMTWRFF